MYENVLVHPENQTIESIRSTPPWGHFDLKSREYVLKTPFAPRPWKNVLWNQHYNTQPTQVSGGISYRRYNDGHIVLLNWSGNKYLYLYNASTGECFCPTFSPIANKDFDSYEHRIALNCNQTTIEQYGLKVQIIQSVDQERPQEYFEIELTNVRSNHQVWRLVFFTDIDLKAGGSKFSSTDYYTADVASNQRRLIIKNNSANDRSNVAFLESTRAFDGQAFNLTDFTGIYGSLARPEALLEAWPQTLSPIDSPILSGYQDYSLRSGETVSTVFTLGLAERANGEFANLSHTTAEHVQRSRLQQRKELEATYNCLEIKTPDSTLDLYVNTWIQHQLHYCADWNRGWGKGFRDGNQDAWAYTLLDAKRSREMIFNSLPYQYSDGRTVRKWAPIDRDAYNDGGVWLIFATHAYLAESGDLEALEETAPFFESDEIGTLYEHLCRGVDYLWEHRGDRGLCLMPFGDWNDRLTGIGKGGKGQSVWTTMALVESLHCMVKIARHTDRTVDAETFSKRADQLIEILRKEAWNGQWYTRAFTDSGAAVGAPECTEGSIYLLTQAWSILAGVATDEQTATLIKAVEDKLQTTHGFRLLTPPYKKFDPSIGLLSATQPGMLENGGNYCHGSMFMTYALSHAGQRGKSLDALKSIFPLNPENPVSISLQEPYSLTNSYCSPESGERSGRSFFSWRTGTAGWALRAAIEGVMGVRATLDGLVINGELPRSDWEHAYLKRTFGEKVLHIYWEKTGSASRTLNGKRIESALLKADDLLDSDNTLQLTF